MQTNITLPIDSVKADILAALAGGCVVVTAPTGSGKSTRVPRFLLEAGLAGRILVLQPRRLAARMLAERVAEECGTRLGGLVGFQTRYEQAVSRETRILFITEGILSRMLVGEPSLPGISAVVFDEFHERSLHTDLGLAMARHTQTTLQPDLKIIVMSATIDAAPIQAYLGDCPLVSAEGRLFPVEITYCDQKTRMLGLAAAAAQTLRQLLDSGVEGDALVFMPGAYEIRKAIEACSALHLREKILLLPLHGKLSPDEQRRVMEPADCRKVIVATNIAETSLTIPGVRHVIDSGLAKVSRYDPVRGVDMLNTENIARDSAEQRAGRAGRIAPGTCHRLWTWLEHSARPPRTAPEIQRVDLAEAVLAVSAFGYKAPAEFPWFERPPERPLALAQALLEMLGFVQQGGGLTALGKELANFPAHPRISLLMRLGAENGCFGLTAWASALLSERPLITGGTSSRSDNTERRQRTRRNARAGGLPSSDFLECFALLHAAREAHFAKEACDSLGISAVAARDICRSAEDYFVQGTRIGWDKKRDANPEMRFLQCLLRAFPDRLARRKETATLACELQNGRHAELSRESVVREEPFFIAAELRETGASTAKLTLSLASGITEEWLLDFFPDQWTETDETYWDERRQQVLRRQTLSCLGLLLEEKIRSDPDPEQAADILAKLLIEGKAPVPNWDEEVERFIARVRWTAGIFPEQGLPLYDDENRRRILQNLCLGETSLKRMKDKDTLAFVKGLLTHAQLRFLDEVAPPHVQLPTGRRMRIEYTPGQQPKGKAKIQDLYDLPRIPELAHGRAHVLLDILAPNMRTVQITDDLAGFWTNLYPKIRTELSRRYPKHKWR